MSTGEVEQLEITRHALGRFHERGDAGGVAGLRQAMVGAVRCRPTKRARKAIRRLHGRSSAYWRSNDWTFVVRDRQVITCWHGETKWLRLA